MQGNAGVVAYVKGWVVCYGRVVRELGSLRKAKKIIKVFRVTEWLLQVYEILFIFDWWSCRPRRPLQEPASHLWTAYQMVRGLVLSARA